MTNKLDELKQRIAVLSDKLRRVDSVIKYLRESETAKQLTYGYTGQRVPDKVFTASVTVNNVVVQVPISETILLSQLEKDTRLDELNKLKEKLAQIEKLLEE